MKKIFALLLCVSMVLGLSQTTVNATTSIPNDQIIKNDESGIPDKNLYASMLGAGDSNKDGILTKSEIINIYGYVAIQSKTDLDLKGLDLASNISSLYLNVSIPFSNFKINNANLLLNLHSLNSLNIYGYNDIDTNTLSQLTNLSTLSISNTNISDISWISSLTNLSSLYLDAKTSFDLTSISELSNLTSLILSSHNHLDKVVDINRLDIKSLKKLTTLSLSGIKTDSFENISKLSNLKRLVVSSSEINSIDGIDNLIQLDSLSLGSNNLTNINALSKLVNLTELDLGYNNLTNINALSNLVNLTKLDLGYNNLTNINALSNLKQLEKLYVDKNKLTDVSILPNLEKLTELNLSFNKIESLPNIKNLINLNFNKMEYGGNYVNLPNNRLSKEELLTKLPDTVKNYPKWIEENISQNYEEVITLNKNQKLSINEINSLLNDKWVAGILIKSDNLEMVPQSILSEISKTNKYIRIHNEGETGHVSWMLAVDNVQNIKGDLNLKVESGSIYENKITEITKQNNLTFLTFKANETLGFQKIFHGDEREYPIVFTIDFKTTDDEFIAPRYVYSYNNTNNAIKKIGSVMYGGGGKYSYRTILNEKENTIFVSAKDNLETVQSEPPITPDKPTNNKEDKVINGTNISTDELINALKDKNVNSVTLNIKNSDSISADLLNSIKESGKSVTFNILNEDDKLKYSWSFNGSDIKNTDGINLDLNINFRSDKQKEIEKITNQSDMFYLQFAFHGKLPAPTTIKVDVSSQYKDGEYIYLYYFNEEKGTIEQASSGIKVENGYAQFTIDHCSTYFFAKEKMMNTINTSDSTQIASIIALMAIALSGIVVMKKRKEN